MKHSVIISVLFFVTCALSAQPFCDIKEFSTNDGLAQNIATGIIQDHKGLLWISTWNGINKFDGYTFENYKISLQEEYAQQSNRITFMAQTQAGNIWCQTYDNRAYIFDCGTKTFYDVLKRTEAESQKSMLVRYIYPFANGISWIVCEDGYCFRMQDTHYRQKDSLASYNTFNGRLKGNQILTIYQDSDQDEWVLTNKGITIIGNKKIKNDFPFKAIHEFQNNIYLLSTSEKLAMYMPQSQSIRFIEIPFPVHSIHSIFTLKEGVLALTTNNGIILFDPTNHAFKQIDIRTSSQPSNEVVSLYEDKTGECWVFSTTPGITRINLETGEKQHLLTPQNEVVDYGRDSRNLIFEDNQGTLWVVPNKGNFGYFDREEKQLKTLYTDINNPNSAFRPLVRYAQPDQQGNEWIISARKIEKMSFYPRLFNMQQLDDNGTEVRAFLQDQAKQLWVASKSGFIRIFHPDGTLKGYLTQQGHISTDKAKFHSGIYCFHEDYDGNIWMGSKGKGLYQLRKNNDDSFWVRQFVHDPNNRYSLSSNDIYSIYADSRKNIWVGSYRGGLNLIKQQANNEIQFINYTNELRNFPTEGFLNVRVITEVADSVMLVGTTNGIISFSNRFGQPEEIMFYHDKGHTDNGSRLVGRDVMDIFTDRQKNTYVLTFTGGINKIVSTNVLSDQINYKSYSPRDGLASDLVLSMIEDATGQLWVVSENALSKFDALKETFDNYDKTFLQYDFSFTEAQPTFNARKQLVFGTDRGVLKIDPNKFRKSSYIPAIVFTHLKVHGIQSSEPIDDLERLSLQSSERNITISFSALDYIRPEDIEYAYRLKGLEDQWNISGKNRSASYINLPAGEYELEVKSTNSDGVWVDNVRTLPIKVLPTFWETGWAILVYFIAFCLFTGVVVYILFYIYRLRHKVTVEQQISNIKLRFFTDISHELRTPLTLITTPVSEILENEPLTPTAKEQLTLVHKNTERMLRLINQILDFRKIQNKKMKILAEETELVGFVRNISESFSLIAKEKGIDYSFETEVNELYVWVDRDKIEKIMFNLLSNAFKYTLKGKAIRIQFKINDKTLSISVEDEGMGIAAEKLDSLFKRFETLAKYNIMQPSSGIGLSLVKELVELHHGSIEVKSQKGKGSTFCITLPSDRKVLEDDTQIEFILADSWNEQDHASPSIDNQPELPFMDEEKDTPEEKQAILIVEDNAELKRLLCTILNKQYHIIEASNGKEGLEKAIDLLPDMVITDVMMPVMDGLEMIKQIKESKDTSHIPIIVLSAKSSLDDRIEGLEHGIDDYITKPFSSSYLKTRITSLFIQRKQLQELFMNNLSVSNLSEPDWLEPSKPKMMPHDALFIKQVMDFMEEQMDNPELVIDSFANELKLSRSLFYRKLKSITGLSPVNFIREIRFKRAEQLIENGNYNFSQIAYMTGFNDPKYFSKSFKKYTGFSPKEYKEQKSKKDVPSIK